jgi:hypothetical protein
MCNLERNVKSFAHNFKYSLPKITYQKWVQNRDNFLFLIEDEQLE